MYARTPEIHSSKQNIKKRHWRGPIFQDTVMVTRGKDSYTGITLFETVNIVLGCATVWPPFYVSHGIFERVVMCKCI